MVSASSDTPQFQGNDRLLFGIIMGVVACWLFAQTTFNIAPDMQRDLGMDSKRRDHLLWTSGQSGGARGRHHRADVQRVHGDRGDSVHHADRAEGQEDRLSTHGPHV